MKKIKYLCAFVFLLFVFAGVVFAANTTVKPAGGGVSEYPRILFLGKNFELKYSTCTPATPVCMNEYYRLKEKGFGWSELITVHRAKNIDDVKLYAENLSKMSDVSEVRYHNNDAMVSFLAAYKDPALGKAVIEQNIFRVMKNPKDKGLLMLQYACKYPMPTDEEMAQTKQKFSQTQRKAFNSLINTDVPNIYEKHLQRW